MLTNVGKLFRPPMAIFALWVTFNIFPTFAVAQELSKGTPSCTLPAEARTARFLPIATPEDSATPKSSATRNQHRLEGNRAYVSSLRNFSPVPNTEACQVVEATLITRNGPNGGWCWLLTTACGDQYYKGDCWYTEEAKAAQVPPVK
jgi:hypothetical protein